MKQTSSLNSRQHLQCAGTFFEKANAIFLPADELRPPPKLKDQPDLQTTIPGLTLAEH
jgi:hypothetical protein